MTHINNLKNVINQLNTIMCTSYMYIDNELYYSFEKNEKNSWMSHIEDLANYNLQEVLFFYQIMSHKIPNVVLNAHAYIKNNKLYIKPVSLGSGAGQGQIYSLCNKLSKPECNLAVKIFKLEVLLNPLPRDEEKDVCEDHLSYLTKVVEEINRTHTASIHKVTPQLKQIVKVFNTDLSINVPIMILMISERMFTYFDFLNNRMSINDQNQLVRKVIDFWNVTFKKVTGTGLVHDDLHKDNIMKNMQSQIMLIDFGQMFNSNNPLYPLVDFVDRTHGAVDFCDEKFWPKSILCTLFKFNENLKTIIKDDREVDPKQLYTYCDNSFEYKRFIIDLLEELSAYLFPLAPQIYNKLSIVEDVLYQLRDIDNCLKMSIIKETINDHFPRKIMN